MASIKMTPAGLKVPNDITIPFITGDGIGKEIMPVCRAVVDAAVKQAYNGNRSIDWLEVMAGQEAFKQYGSYLPDETVAAFQKYLVGLKGPLMTPSGRGVRSLSIMLRQALDLYACQRPFRYFFGVTSPVKYPDRINLCVFRESTEDVYAGIEWPFGSEKGIRFGEFLQKELQEDKVRFPDSTAYGVKPVSREGTERIIRCAIEYALSHNRRSVTLVHNGNIMKYTEGAFVNWAYDVAEREYGTYLSSGRLLLTAITCDAFLQSAILHPEEYGVIVTSNLNGDYISDVFAAQVGGVGMSPGGNINYETGHAIFEATHGVASDITGRNVANPCSLIMAASMMLEYLGWKEAADLIITAIERTLRQGITTADIADSYKHSNCVGTKEFGQSVISMMNSGTRFKIR
ncbi:MAG: NADP-dependent isocitrate dehydrogenase [Bacteroidales bacterium]|nr:NADP-dependent isocitrate dehydrogenase [Bacteroidales bacterium]